jgi:diguanylate cyclase (GGDEF)-like protein
MLISGVSGEIFVWSLLRICMPLPVVTILLVEDNPSDVVLLREALAEIADVQFTLVHCSTLAKAVEALSAKTPDVILLDLGLPDTSGLDAVARIRGIDPHPPLIVLTGTDDELLAIRLLQEGAQDYLTKGRFDGKLLWRAARYAMERQRMQLKLLSLSHSDDLTGLRNRRGFLALAGHHIKLANRTGKSFLVAFIDLDGMKQINDTLGHQEGNRALVDAARVLMDSFRQSDILGRLGGDEFAVFITDADEGSQAQILRRVQQKLDALNQDHLRRYVLSFSIGMVSGSGAEARDLEYLLELADQHMYQQKQSKKEKLKMPAGISKAASATE